MTVGSPTDVGSLVGGGLPDGGLPDGLPDGAPTGPAQGVTTATGPTLASTLRRGRVPLLLAAVLVLALTVLAVLRTTGSQGRLDPDSYGPSGSRAVAELLRSRDVPVTRVDTVQAALDSDGPDALLVLGSPAALAPSELELLADVEAARLVVGADDAALESLGLDAEQAGDVDVDRRRQACDLPVAVRAGDVDLGGSTYRGTGPGSSTGCYAVDGSGTLLELADQRTVLLGAGELLTNDRLADRGNAALALGLLEAGDEVLWLVPRPGRPIPQGDQRPLSDLIADGIGWGALQLLVAVAVLALWRARRLGRVVEEPLPVVVRAAEAVEGRARLYRAAGARGQAADALRAATRDRLTRRLHAGPGASREVLVSIAAQRTGQEPGTLDRLLYGAAPESDSALVHLSDDLNALESALTREVAGS